MAVMTEACIVDAEQEGHTSPAETDTDTESEYKLGEQ